VADLSRNRWPISPEYATGGRFIPESVADFTGIRSHPIIREMDEYKAFMEMAYEEVHL